MRINKVTLTPVGADLSCTSPIMAFNTITGISVGADLSRTSPIYRPPVTIHVVRINLLIFIIVHIADLSAFGGFSISLLF